MMTAVDVPSVPDRAGAPGSKLAGGRRRAAVIASIGVIVLGVATMAGPAAHGVPAHKHGSKAPAATKGGFTAVAAIPHSSDIMTIGSTPGKAVGSSKQFEALRRHGHWERLKPVKVGNPEAEGRLSTVAAASTKAVWVGGNKQFQHGIQDLPAVWRLEGKKFVPQKLPHMENGVASVASISADSPKDAWAVGGVYVLPAGTLAALHWNGRKWSAVPFPEPSFDTTPVAVSALSKTDAWATDGSSFFHWDGRTWTTAGTAPSGTQITSITTMSSKLAYAVGFAPNPAGGPATTAILRYNGKTWSNAKLAKGSGKDELWSVSGQGRSAWAVGSHLNAAKDVTEPQILHTTGGAWKSQNAPNKTYSLNSVSAASSKHAYAVGTHVRGTTVRVADTFLDMFNGHSWKAAASKI